jgi:hypothetical protein
MQSGMTLSAHFMLTNRQKLVTVLHGTIPQRKPPAHHFLDRQVPYRQGNMGV